jgi:hypothetical protein
MRYKKMVTYTVSQFITRLNTRGLWSTEDTSVKKIQDKKVLVVGTEADFAPFEFPVIKNGQNKLLVTISILRAALLRSSVLSWRFKIQLFPH